MLRKMPVCHKSIIIIYRKKSVILIGYGQYSIAGPKKETLQYMTLLKRNE